MRSANVVSDALLTSPVRKADLARTACRGCWWRSRVLAICLVITLLLAFTPLLFFNISAEHNLELESFLKPNKWGNFQDRLKEQRRIFASVREEHMEVVRRLDLSNLELARLQQLIPIKKEVLNKLELKIEELKLAAHELSDRRNVRLYLPHRPMWSVVSAFVETPMTSNVFRVLETTFDYSRCSISTRFRIFLYSESELDTPQTTAFYRQFHASAYRTNNENEACLFVAFLDRNQNVSQLAHWNQNGRNHLLLINTRLPVNTANYGAAMVVAENVQNLRQNMDFELLLEKTAETSIHLPPLLTREMKYLITYEGSQNLPSQCVEHLKQLNNSANQSLDSVYLDWACTVVDARAMCGTELSRAQLLRKSVFVLIFDIQPGFQMRLIEAFKNGAIPLILSTGRVNLPFAGLVDWRLATVEIALSRITEVHFITRSIALNDLLELSRKGRFYYENYLINAKVLSKSILAAVRYTLKVPGEEEPQTVAHAAFNHGFSPLNETVSITKLNSFEEEYLGPIEMPIDSPAYNHNISALSLYANQIWNHWPHLVNVAPEFLTFTNPLPSGAEFEDRTSAGMRPIAPGSGQEFSVALGGNRVREQFTVVILTHDRDAILSAALERLNRCPYLNRVVVVWNNIDRAPAAAWPKLHVPIIFVRSSNNSLNNRFIPYNQIKTEAILSMDDDIDLKQHEIVFAFRVWRENRDRIVGFPARHHARYGNKLFYNSNHTCQLSIILTGGAFLHKTYLHAYTNQMPSIIRTKVDEWMNCEDLAMNFLVSHLTRKPPIKTTNKWTLRCPTCTKTLSESDDHFNKRHHCIRFFINIYGYNPLLFTQYRVDSVLFKTRMPLNHRKCFQYV